MMRAVALVVSCAVAAGFRQRVNKKRAAGGWSTTTDSSHGPCAEHLAGSLPIYFPLLCSGTATNMRLSATATGHTAPKLRLFIDKQSFGDRLFPLWKSKRMWTVEVSRLSAGLHMVKYDGPRLDLHSVTLAGEGSPCTFDKAPNFGREAQVSYTNRGLDVLNGLFGAKSNFSSFKKEQLYFASQTVGKNADGSIDSMIVSNSIWQWMYEYSQDQVPGDHWGIEHEEDRMYKESDITPHPSIALDGLPRHGGQKMKVYEPCNTLSNLAFHEAAVWISCSGYPMTRDEYASMLGAFNGLAAGSAFLHACACDTGRRADTFTMDWLMLQIYQIMVREPLREASAALTQKERDAILFMEDGTGVMATDLAKEMTTIFRSSYNHEKWNASIRALSPPDYMKPIAGIVMFVSWSLEERMPVPWLQSSLTSVFASLLDLVSPAEKDWMINVYQPAVKKLFQKVAICRGKGDGNRVLEYMVKFLVTFVEALVYQEKQIPVPDAIRDVLSWLSRLGFDSELVSDMRPTWDYYNGHDCGQRSAHAVWHERAAHGLIHGLTLAEVFVTRVKADSGSC